MIFHDAVAEFAQHGRHHGIPSGFAERVQIRCQLVRPHRRHPVEELVIVLRHLEVSLFGLRLIVCGRGGYYTPDVVVSPAKAPLQDAARGSASR
jgi:hypothetical protein